ncbi:hypothetical protein JTB14_030283 [Gonioctena quinquepunctata]|nr:hypothetical protein JTB14_030283 [Gonioctena quinquepunctata]
MSPSGHLLIFQDTNFVCLSPILEDPTIFSTDNSVILEGLDANQFIYKIQEPLGIRDGDKEKTISERSSDSNDPISDESTRGLVPFRLRSVLIPIEKCQT